MVLRRADEQGVGVIMVTAGSVEESIQSQQLLTQLDGMSPKPRLYTTVGVHPTRCSVFGDEEGAQSTIKALDDLLSDRNGKRVVAVGECGLDYDRLQFCEKEAQMVGFEAQLKLAIKHRLPLFLHNRNCADDFIRVMSEYSDQIIGGVAHSFTGTLGEMQQLIGLGLYIGVNGCSLKTKENVEVVKAIPLNRLMLETDSPYCEIKATHACVSSVKTTFSSKKKDKYDESCIVKGRCEPCQLKQVFEVVAELKGVSEQALLDAAHANTTALFGAL